jgi:hypothetical protein
MTHMAPPHHAVIISFIHLAACGGGARRQAGTKIDSTPKSADTLSNSVSHVPPLQSLLLSLYRAPLTPWRHRQYRRRQLADTSSAD